MHPGAISTEQTEFVLGNRHSHNFVPIKIYFSIVFSLYLPLQLPWPNGNSGLSLFSKIITIHLVYYKITHLPSACGRSCSDFASRSVWALCGIWWKEGLSLRASRGSSALVSVNKTDSPGGNRWQLNDITLLNFNSAMQLYSTYARLILASYIVSEKRWVLNHKLNPFHWADNQRPFLTGT